MRTGRGVGQEGSEGEVDDREATNVDDEDWDGVVGGKKRVELEQNEEREGRIEGK